MPKKRSPSPTNFIVPLLMNGLQGRMLHLPRRRFKREILIVYGQHSTLEHWWPFALELNRYGRVTMPDLPGFGGMQSFYKIGEKPTLDTFADYLAAFVKLRYKRKRFTIVGLGFGSMVATRMLARCPDLAKKVDVLISVGGIAHHEDLTLSQTKRLFYRFGGRLLATRLPATFFRYVCVRPSVLRVYKKPTIATSIEAEANLWRKNDVRTYFRTLTAIMSIDNCQTAVDLPVRYISVPANQHINSSHVEQHLHVIFSDVEIVKSRVRSQALGTIVYNAQTTQLLPPMIQRVLSVKA